MTDSFVETLNDHFLTQANKSPTQDSNISDLIITTVLERVKVAEAKTLNDAGIFSDHCVIHLRVANLDVTKATGSDEISTRLLKGTAPVISSSLCALYNKSLNQGIFPQEWKIAT